MVGCDGPLRVLLNDPRGRGDWTRRDDLGLSGDTGGIATHAGAVAVADVDNDGDADVLIGGILHRNTPANPTPFAAETGAGTIRAAVDTATSTNDIIDMSVFGALPLHPALSQVPP